MINETSPYIALLDVFYKNSLFKHFFELPDASCSLSFERLDRGYVSLEVIHDDFTVVLDADIALFKDCQESMRTLANIAMLQILGDIS